MRALLLVGALLTVPGCKKHPAPALEVECKFHQDCALTMLGDDCCEGCDAKAGTIATIQARSTQCSQVDTRCPQLECSPKNVTAACGHERCFVQPGTQPH